mgnify:CR=1 FL=1
MFTIPYIETREEFFYLDVFLKLLLGLLAIALVINKSGKGNLAPTSSGTPACRATKAATSPPNSTNTSAITTCAPNCTCAQKTAHTACTAAACTSSTRPTPCPPNSKPPCPPYATSAPKVPTAASSSTPASHKKAAHRRHFPFS